MGKCRIITLAAQKGGPGKSTACLNVGHALHKMGYKVAILDTDERQATAFSFYGQRRLTLHDPLLEGFDMSFPEVAQLSPKSPYRKQIERIREFFDVILIDTKGEFEQFQLDLVRMSNYVLTPVQASEFDLEPAKLVMEAVRHENSQRGDDEQVGLSYLLSKVNPNANTTKHIARQINDTNSHLMANYIPVVDLMPAISALGFTALDAAEKPSLINRVVNNARIDGEKASFDRELVSDLAECFTRIATELMEVSK